MLHFQKTWVGKHMARASFIKVSWHPVSKSLFPSLVTKYGREGFAQSNAYPSGCSSCATSILGLSLNNRHPLLVCSVRHCLIFCAITFEALTASFGTPPPASHSNPWPSEGLPTRCHTPWEPVPSLPRPAIPSPPLPIGRLGEPLPKCGSEVTYRARGPGRAHTPGAMPPPSAWSRVDAFLPLTFPASGARLRSLVRVPACGSRPPGYTVQDPWLAFYLYPIPRPRNCRWRTTRITHATFGSCAL
ncbi:hypothetical protein C8Q80DRAFT_123202 [Daedaleopsis nitida]|nr:hypothetical protein C8Q80DRAFT_123202 [Daedaleopsis nitida]